MAKVGRKEKLTEKMVPRICRIIQAMPDAKIPVDWKNVIKHVNIAMRITFTRSMLSQKKSEDGRKRIAEAFKEAKKVQKRMQSDTAPKYKTAPRAVLQKRIAELEAKNLALQDELENERARKVDILDTFLNTRCDIPKLLDRLER